MTPPHYETRTRDSLSQPVFAVSPGTWPWFAVRIREKFRVAVEDGLSAQGIPLFSPVTTDLPAWSDRIKAISVPLFSGYLFCRFDPQKQLPVLKTAGVIDIVRSGKHLAEVDAGELHAVSRALHAGPHVTSIPYLVLGQRVRVVRGPLLDLEGILAEEKAICTLALAVTMMNRSVALQIDPAHIEPIPPR